MGGLYGVGLGRVFFGESMFALAPDASQVRVRHAARRSSRPGAFALVDCQVHTDHLERFGAEAGRAQRFWRAAHRGRRAKTRGAPGS